MPGTVAGTVKAVAERTLFVLAGRYELGPLVGRGGMADVHAGRDLELDRPVAIKLLVSPYDRDRDFVRRFRREARAAARLNHPNVVAVYDTGSDGDRHFIVTELVTGESLSSLLAREGPLPPTRAVEIASQVCRALSAAHAEGVVHRDVKPGNVMLTEDGRVKVVDFGIARAAGSEAVTRSGLVLGSAPYLSPEQARGEPGEPRSDLYGLGCVLYEMLTGRPPFAGETSLATLYLHVHASPLPPGAVAEVPAGVETVVLRCLEKDPGRRFESAAAVEEALERGATEPLPAADRATVPPATAPLPAVAKESTVPLERADVRAGVAAEASAGGGAPRRRVDGPRPALFLAVFVGVLALAALVLSQLADTPTVGGRRADTSPPQQSPAATGPRGGAPNDAGLDDAAAFGALMEAIDLASASAEPDDVSKLRDHAQQVNEKDREGEPDKAAEEAGKLLEELGKLEEDGKIGQAEARGIRAALEDVLDVIGVSAGGGDDDDDDDDD